jgi:hypothetical protein
VRLLPPDDELEELRLDEPERARDPLDLVDELERPRDPLEPLDELERARDPLDLLDDPLRVPLALLRVLDRLAPALLPVLDRREEELLLLLLLLLVLEPLRFAVEPRPRLAWEDPLRPELLDLARLRPPCCERLPSLAPSPWSSSPFPRNFFATPTAAGTATPMAAPATTFLPVDIPSFSLSLFSISTSISVAGQVPA